METQQAITADARHEQTQEYHRASEDKPDKAFGSIQFGEQFFPFFCRMEIATDIATDIANVDDRCGLSIYKS